jgi:hypothetical protein
MNHEIFYQRVYLQCLFNVKSDVAEKSVHLTLLDLNVKIQTQWKGKSTQNQPIVP